MRAGRSRGPEIALTIGLLVAVAQAPILAASAVMGWFPWWFLGCCSVSMAVWLQYVLRTYRWTTRDRPGDPVEAYRREVRARRRNGGGG